MAGNSVPKEWELGADPRYKKQNMERAMRGKIERGLVELITNADDSYNNIEDSVSTTIGKIIIEIEGRRSGQSRLVIIRDFAEGMNRQELYKKLGFMGGRTSGFEKGKARRGLHGRRAKDVAAFGLIRFESISDGFYNQLIIPPSLKCHFVNEEPLPADPALRSSIDIIKGNGTKITVEVDARFKIPQHETLLKDFSRYFSLRDLFSNPKREVILIYRSKKRENRLLYHYPVGKVVFNDYIKIPEYSNAGAHLTIQLHTEGVDHDILPTREGIIVKSEAAIHDCTYFGLENENLAWRFTGQLRCDYIDQLVREYDDREDDNPDNPQHPTSNPQRLLDPFRDGLIIEHPFVRALYASCKNILESHIEELKKKEESTKRDVINNKLAKKLQSLSRECSKLLQQEMKDIEEDIPSGTNPNAIKLGLHIIPPGDHELIVEQSKTFSIIIKHFEPLDIISLVIISSTDIKNIKIRESLVHLLIRALNTSQRRQFHAILN